MRQTLEGIIEAVGAPSEVFAPWLDAVEAVGPTPPGGPLRFDVLAGEDVFGITIFDHGDDPGLGVARRTARTLFGDAGGLDALLGRDAGARHLGVRWSPAGCVLKIYRTGHGMIGVDLDARGPHRRRSYRRMNVVASRAHARLTGWSHTIEARLDPGDARGGAGKTTTAIIFRPDAPFAALAAAAAALRPGSSWSPPSCLEVPRARAAALELDRWDEGREAFDALITLG